jgi:predicted ATPase
MKNGTSLERIIHGISDQQVLLILDNVEQLIKTASRLIFELLTASAGVKILATSREVLRLDGEQVYRVLPLEIPAEADLNSLDINSGPQFSALALFTERARMVQPDFQ